MSYQPFAVDNEYELNSVVIEGNTDMNNIITNVGTFETNTEQAGANQTDIEVQLDRMKALKKNPKYQPYIQSNGTVRPGMVDEMIDNYKQISQANAQSYILGTVALASLTVLMLVI